MKINKIIEKLCKHEISSQEAIDKITIIINGLRKNNSIEFVVEQIGFTIENNHVYLTLKLPYEYSKIKDKIKKGDKVDVIILP